MPLISVIVPVYKVEAYLPACVDSILSQTFSDFELILVDDGSPDACGAMCDGYARENSRIHVIHQENGGLSAARNAGLDIAKGKYVTFVDSDDVIMRDYLRELYLAITKNDAEVACCKFQNFEDDKPDVESAKSISKVHVKVMTGHDAVLSIYNATGEVNVNAYGKLFMMILFCGKRFPVGKLHEDQALIPIVLCEAEAVVATDVYGYFYRQRPGSIMQKAFSQKRFDNLEGIDGCINYFRKKKDNELVAAAKKARKRVNALLVIDAYSSGVRGLIPKQYSLTKLRAMIYCHKYASDETCSWYLEKISHKAAILHEYCKKINSLFQI